MTTEKAEGPSAPPAHGNKPGWEKDRARLELKALAAEVSAILGRQADPVHEEWVILRSGNRQATWIWMRPGNHGLHLIDKGDHLELEAWNNDGGENMAVRFPARPTGIPAAYLAAVAEIVIGEQAMAPRAADRAERQVRDLPVNMSHAQLCALLEDVSRRVNSGDSLEGNLTWAIPEDEDAPAQSFDVMACYRVGNLQGQGGMRIIRQESHDGAQ